MFYVLEQFYFFDGIPRNNKRLLFIVILHNNFLLLLTPIFRLNYCYVAYSGVTAD